MIFIIGMITGLLLYVVGSIMDRRERAEDERRWQELHGRDDTHRTR